MSPESATSEHALSNGKQPKVLLVEDHADLRDYLRRHLSRDFKILEASRGEEGLEIIRAEMPAAVVSDIMMPGLDGFGLCHAIKSDPEISFIPVILLTAKTDRRSIIEGLELGADDYIPKPFDPVELALRLRNLLRAQARTLARFASGPAGISIEVEPVSSQSSHRDRALSERISIILNQDSHEPSFDVGTLAEKLGMSRASLYRSVGALFGFTPSDLIFRFRLKRAARMLSQRSGNVGEIAYAVGFRDLSHFVKRFRERYGQTPAAYGSAQKTSGKIPR